MTDPKDLDKLGDAPSKESVDKIREAVQKAAEIKQIKDTVDKAAQKRKEGK